ncbi:hypothetical protein [Haloechinothrix salitolerans]|uniref:WXG100 family type VII secretion target n=1 Tax=Haloechinothrix salitolerans TaxID=926830 RepID=A0ABW2BYY7_9PSEU
MDFADLMEARPAGYNAAADALRAFGEDVRDRAVDYWNQVAQPLKDTSSSGIWGGAAADAAQVPMMDLQLALNRAADQIEAVPKILTQYASDLEGFQRRLTGIVAEARATGAEVSDTGQVTVSAQVQENNPDRPKLAEEIAADIRRVLEQATQRDVDCSVEIRDALADETLDAHDVGTQYRDAIKDANHAARLLQEGSLNDMSDELPTLLRDNADNPEFAAALFNQLGGKGTVEALERLAGLRGMDEGFARSGAGRSHADELDAIHTELGRALAMATDPDSAFHVDMSADSRWMQDFRAAGKETFGGSAVTDPVTGYQVIGGVLRNGTFSEEFLDVVSDDMYAMEQNDPDVFKVATDAKVDPNPLDGLMVALEKNPAAATDFFSQKTERIDYMLDRNGAHGHEELGQAHVIDAIDAATRGADPGSPRSEIFEHAVQHAGDRSADAVGLVNDQARESMGQLLQGHMGQVHDAFGGADNVNFDPATDAALNRVIGDLAHSPEAYARLANAERAYTVANMHAAAEAGNADVLVNEAKKMGGLMAQLDAGRAEALGQEWEEKQEDYNNRVNAIAQIGGLAVDHALGAVPGADDVTRPLVDHLVESAKVDYSENAIADQSGVFDDSRRDLKEVAKNYIWNYQLHGQDVPESLMRGNEPIPFNEMTAEQRGTLSIWLRDHATFDQLAGDIEGAYDEGAAHARLSQSGGA